LPLSSLQPHPADVQAAGSVIALVVALACASCVPPRPSAGKAPGPLAPARCVPGPARSALDALVRSERDRYRRAIAKARSFLDHLDVDPFKLRAARLKGKKKLVEALDAYARLLEIAPPEERPAILSRIQVLAKVTLDERYHDMLEVDDRTFHEDATSYLRAAVLLERLGLDISRYRAAIRAMKGRLDAHLTARGPHQRRAFHGYYQRLGLREPFALESALDDGLIAHEVDPRSLSRPDTYALTHEIFAAYDFGERVDDEPFGDAARHYLRGALPELTLVSEARGDPDLLAELTTCLRYLRFTGDPSYSEALRYLLDAQNEDGSWGHYGAARARLGDLVAPGLYLHTTMVTIEALSLGFDDSYRRREALECPPAARLQ
jgi:hypothetical protein